MKLTDFDVQSEIPRLEEILSRGLPPPRNLPAENRLSTRFSLPGLDEAVRVCAARARKSRGFVTYNLSGYALDWVEDRIGFIDEAAALCERCVKTGHTDLLKLLSVRDFLCSGWVADRVTTIVVRDDVKGRASRIGDALALPMGAVVQIGMAGVWASDDGPDFYGGTVQRCFQPHLQRWAEMVDWARQVVPVIDALLDQRITAPLS